MMVEGSNIIKNINIFHGLTEDELTLIANLTKIKIIKKNTLIFSKNDENHSIYIVSKGNVDVFILTESGKELILAS